MTRRALAGLAVLLAAAVAGCGSAPAPRASDTPGSTQPSVLARGGHAEAARLAARLLRLARLPAGARALAGPVPAALRHAPTTPGAVQLVDLDRFASLRQSPSAAAGFLLSHRPAGMRQDGTGSGTGLLQVDFVLAALPPGIYYAGIAEALVAGPDGGSVLRVDAQVIWYPPRSAAERLRAASFAAVVVRQSVSSRPAGPATRTITDSGRIANLVRLLNGLPAAPVLVLHCPAATSRYQLTFRPAASGQAQVIVTTSGCATDQVRLVRCARQPLTYCSVSGGIQPALWDPAERLASAARRLLAAG